MKLPARGCSVRPGSVASDPRLSLRSRAYSGRAVFRLSRLMAKFLVSSGSARPAASQTAMRRKPVAEAALRGLQDVFALLPVAGAEFVGLQGVAHAQHFLRVAADAEEIGRASGRESVCTYV